MVSKIDNEWAARFIVAHQHKTEHDVPCIDFDFESLSAYEGTAADTWQILMAAQLPIVAHFIVKWLPKRPRESLQVLALLAGTWLANFAAVYWLT